MLYYYVDARKWFKGPKITLDLDGLTTEQQEALREEGLEIEGLAPEIEGLDTEKGEKSV